MPIEKLVDAGTQIWALWKISETEDELKKLLKTEEEVPETISNSQKRLEWFAGRVLTQRLLEEWLHLPSSVVKNEHGKPFLKSYPYHISLSHSFPFAAAIMHKTISVGIDLEQPKEKLLRVAHRVLSLQEQDDAGTDIVKHCVYWCGKETLIKIYGKKDLILAENLQIGPFRLESEGEIVGKIIVNNMETLIPLCYEVFDDFVLVFNAGRSDSKNRIQ